MNKHFHRNLCCQMVATSALVIGMNSQSARATETQGYVVSAFHTATYSHEDNCPGGGNGGQNEINRRALEYIGYSPEEARTALLTVNDNEGPEVGEDGELPLPLQILYRGRLNGEPASINHYPESQEDYNLELVSGPYALGFDLDGSGPEQESGFEDPETGEKGVDNELFRAMGCFLNYDRTLPDRPIYEDIIWDFQRDVMPALLLSVTGEDLSEDGEVTVTFHKAVEHIRRNMTGGPLHDATYVIDPNPFTFGELKGRIEDGVLTTYAPGARVLWEGEAPTFTKIDLTNARLRLNLIADHSLEGWLGGYQPWMDFWFLLSAAGEFMHYIDVTGTYYNVKKLADAHPDPDTGENASISATFRVELAPAFLATVDGKLLSGTVLSPADRPKAALAEQTAAANPIDD